MNPFPGPRSVLVLGSKNFVFKRSWIMFDLFSNVDNASIHHGVQIVEILEQYGIIPFYLPPCSPGKSSKERKREKKKKRKRKRKRKRKKRVLSFFFSFLVDQKFCLLRDLNPAELSDSFGKAGSKVKKPTSLMRITGLKSGLLKDFAEFHLNIAFLGLENVMEWWNERKEKKRKEKKEKKWKEKGKE